MENDRYILRSITDEIMYEIMRLSGQEYVDMYASVAKEEQKKADKAEQAASARAAETAGSGREGFLTRCSRSASRGRRGADGPRAGHDVPCAGGAALRRAR